MGDIVDNRLVRLTDTRVAILKLVQQEGAVSASDVARDLIRGRNQRTAKAQLAALHKLGLITPIRSCEYKLSDAGQAWLDLRAKDVGRG